MTRQELEQWLCGDRTRLPTAEEIAALLGLAPHTASGAMLSGLVRRLARGWFAIVVLRDLFGDDAGVRRWLRASRPEFGSRCALDLLWAGETRAVEDLAMRDWHRPAVAWPHAVPDVPDVPEAPRLRIERSA